MWLTKSPAIVSKLDKLPFGWRCAGGRTLHAGLYDVERVDDQG
jgi:hypothetical protein